jgi:tetratricopeptide (TPR) repeat protein
MAAPLLELSFEELNSLFARVQQMVGDGQYHRAKRILKSVTEELRCFQHGMAWYELAEAFEQTGELDKARQAYLEALECEWNDIYAAGVMEPDARLRRRYSAPLATWRVSERRALRRGSMLQVGPPALRRVRSYRR